MEVHPVRRNRRFWLPRRDRIGVIEWMENTCTLKDFLRTTMTEEEKRGDST